MITPEVVISPMWFVPFGSGLFSVNRTEPPQGLGAMLFGKLFAVGMECTMTVPDVVICRILFSPGSSIHSSPSGPVVMSPRPSERLTGNVPMIVPEVSSS